MEDALFKISLYVQKCRARTLIEDQCVKIWIIQSLFKSETELRSFVASTHDLIKTVMTKSDIS